jgi:ankyrin repeat protein
MLTKARDDRGSTAMHWDVLSDNIPTLQYLEDQGLSIDATDNDGMRPIHIAIPCGYVEIVRWLKESGAQVSSVYYLDGCLPVHSAAMKGHLGVIQYLRNAGEPVFDGGGQDANVRHQTNGNHPLHVAAKFGQIDVVRYLVHEGGAVDVKNVTSDTPLHLAAKYDKVDVVRYLLEKAGGADVQNGGRQTPLHLAAELAPALIEKSSRADPSARNSLGQTPLHLAAQGGHVRLLRYLASWGDVDVNTQANDGWTAMHFAGSMNQNKVIEVLSREFGADPNVRSAKLKQTALHLAAERNHIHAVKQLVKSGAKLNALNMFKREAKDIAKENGYWDLAKELDFQYCHCCGIICICNYRPSGLFSTSASCCCLVYPP